MGDAVAEEYKSSLADLSCNSKVFINVLTMLAEENIKYAVNIVETIADHVELCSPDRKLPCLYLIDSIVKNVGQEYLTIFSQHIVSMFASVFQKVDERTRAQMYKLRLTWNTVFPNKILYALDLKTKQVDPAWPVNAQPPAHSIHINPKFLGTPLTKGITLNPTQASPTIIQNEENPVKVPQHIIQQLLREDKTKLLNSKPLLNPEQALPSAIQDEENALKAKQQIVIQLRDKQQQLKLQEEKRLKISKSLPSAAIAPCVVSTLATGPSQPPYVSKPPVGPSSTVSHIGSTLTTVAYNQQVCAPSKLTNNSSLLNVYNPNTSKCEQGHATQKVEAKPSQLVLNVTQTKPTVAPSKVIVAPNHRDPRQRDPRRAARSNQLASEHTNAVPNALPASSIATSKVSNAVPSLASVVKPVTSETKASLKEPTKAKEVASEAIKDSDKKNEAASSDSKKSSTNLSSDIQIPTSKVEPSTSPEKTVGGKKRRKVHEQKCKDKHKPATSDTKISPPSTKPSKEKSLEKKKVSPNEKKSSSSHASRNHTEEKRHNTRLRSRSPLHKTDKKSPKSHGNSRDPRQRKLSSDHAKRKLDVSSRNGKNDDVDLRLLLPNSESDRSSKGPKHDVTSEKTEESYEPPEKKTKEDKENVDVEDNVLFGSEDQDYRQLPTDGQKGSYEGWATYKKAHPDEFKTRPLHSRDSIDSNQSTYDDYRNNNEKVPPKSPREICSPNEMEYDRLGRPRLHRMRQLRRSDSIQGCLRRDAEFPDSFQNSYNLHHLLSEQKSILREAEERYQLGHMSKEDFDGIQRGLESISRSTAAFRKEEYGPHRSFPHFPPKNIPHPRHIKSEFKSNSERIIYNDYNHLPPKQEANAQGPKLPPPAVRTIRLDSKLRNIHFIGDKALVLMDNDEPRQLMFEGKPTEVHIEGLKPILLRFDGKPVEFELDGVVHSMKFGAPSRELYINNYPYEGKFGGPPFSVRLGNGRLYNISLGGPPPIVQVGKEPAYELYQQYLDQNRSDVDMRLKPNPVAKADTDWRPMGQKNSVQDDQRSTSGPLFIKSEPPSYDHEPSASDFEEGRFSNRHDDSYQDQRDWKPDRRPLPPEVPDVHGPRHPEWRQSPFQDVKMANSPRNTPPRDIPPHSNDWDQSVPPRSYKPEQRPEPMNRPWMPRILGPNSSRFTRPPGPEHLFNVPRDNAIQRFEGRAYPDCPRPPSFRLPLRPPFIIRKIRPEFGNEPISRPLLPPPQHVLPSPWRQPRAIKPTENIRHPVLLPPPQPPIHMRMPVPIKQEVPSNSAMPAVTVPPVSASSGLLPPPPFINLTAAPAEPSVSSTPAAPTQNIDINSLVSKLLAAGIISKPASDEPEVVVKDEKDKEESSEESEKKEDKEKENIPPIELKLESLKVKQSGVISSIYRGSQCASCGMRFKEVHGERYSRHLDWHFRMNRREKDGVKKAFSRKWYYEVEDWTQFEEFEDLEERARSFFELQADEQFQIEPVVEVPSVPVSTQETETCVVCEEPFQLFWVEDEEEWHLRNAVRHDEQAYHPSCYEDFVKASLKVETQEEEKPDIDVVKKEPADEDVKEDLPDATEIKAESVNESVNIKLEEEMAKEISGLVSTVLETIETEEEENRKREEIRMKEEMLQGRPGEEEVIGLISESDAEMEITPTEESERVVLGSGGIVMKVRAESLKPSSPLVEVVTEKEALVKEAEESEEEEFRPPTPDPRYQVLPPVQRGTELSGLCCIM